MVNWRWILLTCHWTPRDSRSNSLWVTLLGNPRDSHIGWLKQTCAKVWSVKLCISLDCLAWVILSESQQSSEMLMAVWSDEMVGPSGPSLLVLVLDVAFKSEHKELSFQRLEPSRGTGLTVCTDAVHQASNWWIKYSADLLSMSLPVQALGPTYTINYRFISFH